MSASEGVVMLRLMFVTLAPLATAKYMALRMSKRDAVPFPRNAFRGISFASGAAGRTRPATMVPWPKAGGSVVGSSEMTAPESRMATVEGLSTAVWGLPERSRGNLLNTPRGPGARSAISEA